jgi:hypothetical protein
MFLVHNIAIQNLSGLKEVTTYTAHKWIHLLHSLLELNTNFEIWVTIYIFKIVCISNLAITLCLS